MKIYKSWDELNAALYRKKESIKVVQQLLADELAGPARKMFVLRLFSRFNRLRYLQEREALLIKLAAKGSLNTGKGRRRG